MPDPDRYQPIEDYAAIGNLRTAALIGRNGSIDWCCFPELNDPSVFGSILDADQGGRFRVSLADAPRGEQRYLDDTNVLETVFQSPAGRLVVTDFLPLTGDLNGRNDSTTWPEIHRILHAPGGDIEVEIEWAPRFDYALATPHIERTLDGYMAVAGQDQLHLVGVPNDLLDIVPDAAGPRVSGRFTLRAGTSVVIVTAWDEHPGVVSLERSLRALDDTAEAWRAWAQKPKVPGERAWGGSWGDLLTRSELTLKLLTHAETGAIAAAPTTSLPETIGGVRNWDYRYCWIRDAAMTADAFLVMGHSDEMRDYVLWAERASEPAGAERALRIMYGLHGETPAAAEELGHLEGYRGSRPVLIGNDALDQVQPDIFGELLDAGIALVRSGDELTPDVRQFLPAVADRACDAWTEPDHGLWEMPVEPRHYTYSKLMIWVALDRALRLAEGGWIEGDVARWRAIRQATREWILSAGFDAEQNSFVQRAGSSDLDASSLLIPVMGLLPFDDPRVQGTIDQTLGHLTENGLVYRYRSDDGLPGNEGAFVLCSWWLVDALALSGRIDEAERLFEGLIARVNHVGLLAEQIDSSTGMFLGNFPQALSHIGLIISTANIARAHGQRVPGIPDTNSIS